MYRAQPISITVESKNTYKVRFLTETGEEEHTVTIDDVALEGINFPLLVGDAGFLKITEGDPAAAILHEAISSLHKARQFEYEEPGTTVEIKSAPKKASA